MKWLQFAYRNIWRNQRRSMMTITLTAIGTLGILSTGGFALFTYDSLKEFATRATGHIVLAHDDYFDVDEEMPVQLGIENSVEIKKALLQEPEVKSVIQSIEFTGLISNGDKSTIFMGKGVDPEMFNLVGPAMKLLEGKYLSKRIDLMADAQVVLGQGLAKSMGAEVGSSLTLLSTTSEGALNAMDVLVQGIYTTGVPDMDDRMLYVHLPQAQELLLTSKIHTLSIHLFDTHKTQAFSEHFKKMFTELGVTTWRDHAFFYTSVKNLYNRIFGVMGIVILLMISFAVSNTIAMTVVERTREIGTLRALGSFDYEVSRVILLEAAMISLIGVLIGVVLTGLCVLGLTILDFQMPPPPGQTEGYPLRINFSAQLTIGVVLVMLLLAQIAAWIAARSGVNKPITEALAHV